MSAYLRDRDISRAADLRVLVNVVLIPFRPSQLSPSVQPTLLLALRRRHIIPTSARMIGPEKRTPTRKMTVEVLKTRRPFLFNAYSVDTFVRTDPRAVLTDVVHALRLQNDVFISYK